MSHEPHAPPRATAFFFTDSATSNIYTLSLHDALPILLTHLLMSSPTMEPAASRTANIAGLPRWLLFSLLTIVVWGAWGAVSKMASNVLTRIPTRFSSRLDCYR